MAKQKLCSRTSPATRRCRNRSLCLKFWHCPEKALRPGKPVPFTLLSRESAGGLKRDQRFEVIIASEATRDIEDIYHYIAEHDGLVNAARVLVGIESACARLAEFPSRGNVPKEL